jgi:predicted RNA polymerase sigma factor
MSDLARQIEATFRQEHGQVLGTLVARLGDLDLAEDALQDAMLTAPKESTKCSRGWQRSNGRTNSIWTTAQSLTND